MSKFLSVIIHTYNREEVFLYNLRTVLAQDYPDDRFEIILMDDASSDGTWMALSGLAAAGARGNLRIIRNEKNLEIVGCRHKLLAELSPKSDLVVLLDDDVSLPVNFLSEISGFMEKYPDIGALGPRVVYAKTPGRTAHEANFVNRVTGFYSSKDASTATDCDWLIACCLTMRADALRGAGGFDPSFVNSHEEVDLCLKMKSLGYRVVYYPGLVVSHDIGEKKRKIERLYYLYRNKFLVIKKNFRFPWRLTATLANLCLGFPKYILESIIFNKRLVPGEVALITKAVYHGLIGRTGRLG